MHARRILQTEAVIGSTSVVLARAEDRQTLRQQVEEAAATTGRFIDIDAADGSEVNVFVTPTTHVSFHTRTVTPDETSGGMVLSPGGNWDLL